MPQAEWVALVSKCMDDANTLFLGYLAALGAFSVLLGGMVAAVTYRGKSSSSRHAVTVWLVFECACLLFLVACVIELRVTAHERDFFALAMFNAKSQLGHNPFLKCNCVTYLSAVWALVLAVAGLAFLVKELPVQMQSRFPAWMR